MSEKPEADGASSTIIRVAPMFFVYLAVAPGVAALIYIGLLSLVGAKTFPTEQFIGFYLFGAPAALGAAIVHALLRNTEAFLAFCAVALVAGVLGLIGGPGAAAAGFCAACLCFPLARFLSTTE